MPPMLMTVTRWTSMLDKGPKYALESEWLERMTLTTVHGPEWSYDVRRLCGTDTLCQYSAEIAGKLLLLRSTFPCSLALSLRAVLHT
jgi:hypothetical protein